MKGVISQFIETTKNLPSALILTGIILMWVNDTNFKINSLIGINSAYAASKEEKNKITKSFVEFLLNNSNINPSIKVVDWDTVQILFNWVWINCRLNRIDAPESSAYRFWYSECLWKETKTYLTFLIKNWNEISIKLWENLDNATIDSKWRPLIEIEIDWENINSKLIQEWYAFGYWGRYLLDQQFTAMVEWKNIWWEQCIDYPWNYDKNFIFTEDLNCAIRKTSCDQITTCEEAYFRLLVCKITSLDWNNDGIPCNSKCRGQESKLDFYKARAILVKNVLLLLNGSQSNQK